MIEKFTFDIQAPQIKSKKLILVKDEMERREHVVLKLLAFMMFYEEGLQVEVGVDMHYKPDLVIPGDHGIPRLWIDCGKIAVRKIESLSGKLRTTRLIVVKENKREMEAFRKVIDKKADHADRVEYLAFEPGFVASLANALRRTNEITLYPVLERVIGVALNDEVFESQLYP